MKYIFIAVAVLCILIGGKRSFADEQIETLRYCYNNYDLSPYFNGAGAEIPPLGKRGIVIDIMDQVAAEIGLPIEWVRRPWPRCLTMMEKGEVDGLAGANFTPQRGREMAFPLTHEGEADKTRSVTSMSYSFFYNIYNPLDWNGVKFNRERVSIGAPRGYIVTDVIRDMGFLHVQEISTKQGFKDLNDRKIDVYVGSLYHYNVARETLDNADIRLKRLDPPVYVSYQYHPVSKAYYERYSELVERFWTIQAPLYERWRLKKTTATKKVQG